MEGKRSLKTLTETDQAWGASVSPAAPHLMFVLVPTFLMFILLHQFSPIPGLDIFLVPYFGVP